MTKSLDIVFEDDDIIVINKPSNLLTIATSLQKVETLYHFVSNYVKQRYGKNSKIFIVHRLDKMTSGLVVFAKSYQVKLAIQNLFEQGKVIRKYHAIVTYKPKFENGEIINYLIQDKFGNVFISNKNNKNAKKAITKYRVIEKNNLGYLLDIEILTGRKNQIRIGLANLSCPILGDSKFGGKKARKLYLNAYFLSLAAFKKEYVFKI